MSTIKVTSPGLLLVTDHYAYQPDDALVDVCYTCSETSGNPVVWPCPESVTIRYKNLMNDVRNGMPGTNWHLRSATELFFIIANWNPDIQGELPLWGEDVRALVDIANDSVIPVIKWAVSRDEEKNRSVTSWVTDPEGDVWPLLSDEAKSEVLILIASA